MAMGSAFSHLIIPHERIIELIIEILIDIENNYGYNYSDYCITVLGGVMKWSTV